MEIETDNPLDVNAHCLECPGTGWLWNGDKCFKLNGRPRACPVPQETRPGPRALRPPLAAARAPQVPVAVPLAPVLITPEPAPPASFDIFDKVAVARQIRAWYSAHHTPRIIAVWLNRLAVPNERASHWYTSHVRAMLIREQAPAKACRVTRTAVESTAQLFL